jgi:hypothetical protein
VSFIGVLGMHRSGTSCLAGIMQGIGVELGEVHTENKYNKRGNRESNRIVALNEALLVNNGGSWYKPTIVENWTDEDCAERDAIVADLSGRASEHWGFKDPRMLFVLDFWLEAIPEPKFIGTYRHPNRVTFSLHNRDKSTFAFGWDLWRQYNEQLLNEARKRSLNIVNFDAEPEHYLNCVINGLLALGLDDSQVEKGRDFFDVALRSQTSLELPGFEMPENVVSLYEQLNAYCSDGSPTLK